MDLGGIHHVALNVRDLARAEKFYTEVLGFTVTHRFQKGLQHIMLDTGNAHLALFESPELDLEEPLHRLSEDGYMHLAFRATQAQFEAVVAELKDKTDLEGPVRRGRGTSVYFNDPDGNHLEIHADDE